MQEELDDYIEKIKKESQYSKFVTIDIIHLLIDRFKSNSKIDYSHNIENPLDMALEFYKNYNKDYYEMILKGINEKRIIIDNNDNSHVDTSDNKTYIKFCNNDSDIFIFVHELAHYIDRNSHIIPNEYWFLSETFAFYIEKKLEKWLDKKQYSDLIVARQNNRIYFESKMLEAIRIELKYEDIIKQNGSIQGEDIDLNDLKVLKKYNYDNLINYLLQYPIANIISNYLIEKKGVKDIDFVDECLKINLYDLVGTKKNKNLRLN